MKDCDDLAYAKFLESYKLETCILVYCLYLVGRMVWNIIFVLPQFESIFASMNVELPLATRVLMKASAVANRFWPIVFPLGVVAVIHAIWSLYMWLKKRGMGPKGVYFRAYSHLCFIGAMISLIILEGLAEIAVWMPMLRLINNVE